MNFSKLTHQEAFTITGTWWVVGDARKKVIGTLHYQPEQKMRLELYGRFGEPRNSFAFSFPGRHTILDVTEKGRAVSLHNCYCLKAHPGRTEFLVNIAFLNVHIRKLTALRFKWMFVSLTTLTEWAQTFAIKDVSTDEDWGAVCQSMPPIIVHVPRHRITLKVEQTRHCNWHGHSSVDMGYANIVTVHGVHGTGWKRYNRITGDVQRLITLLSGDPNSIVQVGGVLKSSKNPLEEVLPDEHVYVFRPQTEQTLKREVFGGNMLFPRSEIGDRLEAVCDRWFSVAHKLRSIFDVLFGEYRTRSHFLEARFFHVAQCLEAFHHAAIQGRKGRHISKRAFRIAHAKMMEALQGKVSKTLLPDVRRVLWNANDISFLERIEALLAKLEPKTAAFITNDPKRFAVAIRETRNIFTHLDKRKRNKAFPQHHWNDAVERMLALLFIHMLKLCGLPEPEILERMLHSQNFSGGPYTFPTTQAESEASAKKS